MVLTLTRIVNLISEIPFVKPDQIGKPPILRKSLGSVKTWFSFCRNQNFGLISYSPTPLYLSLPTRGPFFLSPPFPNPDLLIGRQP